jgi:hypothetical protein
VTAVGYRSLADDA